MVEITRRLEIDAGHRLLKHEGKCRNLHGHRYVFEVTLKAPDLDEVGRVIDFGKVKEVLGGWLDVNWDHGFILQAGDPLHRWLIDHHGKFYVMKEPPSAENMAAHFGKDCIELVKVVDRDITVARVRCYETPSCWADWSP